jgi:hypothetical protein
MAFCFTPSVPAFITILTKFMNKPHAVLLLCLLFLKVRHCRCFTAVQIGHSILHYYICIQFISNVNGQKQLVYGITLNNKLRCVNYFGYLENKSMKDTTFKLFTLVLAAYVTLDVFTVVNIRY